MKDSSIIELKSGDILCQSREDINKMYLITKGRITAYSTYGRIVLTPGAIVGITGIQYGISLYTYVASEDVSLVCFEAGSVTDAASIFDKYSNNTGEFVLCNESFVMELVKIYLSLFIRCRKKDSAFMLNNAVNKWELDKHNGLVAIERDIKLKFYGSNSKVAVAAITENTAFANLLHDACSEMADFLGINLDYIPPVKEEPLETKLPQVIPDDLEFDASAIIEELNNSLENIIEYADFYEEDAEALKNALTFFKSCSDKMSVDDSIRQCRKQITNLFYELYFQVFIKAASEDSLPPYISMFLNFGYIDTELAGEDNTVNMYKLSHTVDNLCSSDNVFTVFTWLKMILWGDRLPSRSTFDLSYEEYVRQQIKEGALNLSEAEAFEDNELKVRFEIENLFKNSHYMTHGRVSTFVPVVIKEYVMKELPSSLLTAQHISMLTDEIKKTDFSLFYRSIVYTNESIGMSQELIYTECLPEIILTPCIGTNGVLWEEINGRNRATPARMLFPIFCMVNPMPVMLNVYGRYRWEICKRIQGNYWNIITEKSLTSEFYDYLLFYKKNKDLTDQVKEKLKSTLISCRNNYSEVFARDYEAWIMYESKGKSKLNKISRTILAKYCPFTKNIRTALKSNPIFTNPMEQYDRYLAHKRRHFDNIYKALTNKGLPIPKEIETTMNYFDM